MNKDVETIRQVKRVVEDAFQSDKLSAERRHWMVDALDILEDSIETEPTEDRCTCDARFGERHFQICQLKGTK